MKIYSAVLLDSKPLLDVAPGSEGYVVFPTGSAVAALGVAEGRWHVSAKANGTVYSGTVDATDLDFRDWLSAVNEGVNFN